MPPPVRAGEWNAVLNMEDKKALRKKIRQLRTKQVTDELRCWSEEICDALLNHPKVVKAHTVMLFWSMPDEVDIRSAVRMLYAQGKTVVLPRVVTDTEMVLCEYRGDETLTVGRCYGILEPQMPLPTDTDIDVIIVPGVAFTSDGWRLGRGKGYYDRMLMSLPGVCTIGVCYAFQIVQDLPHDTHDVRIDEVLYNK